VVALAATGTVPIVVAAVTGAAAMVLSGALGMRDAVRALDYQIIFTIATALALGAAMQETGGAAFLAGLLLGALDGASPAVVLSAFFLLVGGLANIISTKATAVLFTPIAVGIARGIGVPVEIFAVAVIFAANCSFASPIGYQTNLLVMVPGRYRFIDFVKAGLPLLIIVWLVFSLFAPWYYGL
jgi:di/tricarboxylate transporter